MFLSSFVPPSIISLLMPSEELQYQMLTLTLTLSLVQVFYYKYSLTPLIISTHGMMFVLLNFYVLFYIL